MSIGNWDNDGKWIPLLYAANLLDRSPENLGIDISVTVMNESTVKLRGYDVPYFIQNDGHFYFSVCNNALLRTGLQIRWLQTTSLYVQTNGYVPRDIVALKDVSVVLYTNEENSVVLSTGFMDFSLRNSDILSEITCTSNRISYKLTSDESVYFGALCTTYDCEAHETQITASRTVTTPPLKFNASESFIQHSSTTSAILSCIEPTSSTQSPLTKIPTVTQISKMETVTHKTEIPTVVKRTTEMPTVTRTTEIPMVTLTTEIPMVTRTTEMPTVTTSISDYTSSVSIHQTPDSLTDIFLINARRELEITTAGTLYEVCTQCHIIACTMT